MRATLYGRQQKGTEPAPVAICIEQIVLFKKKEKEFLAEILRLVLVVASSSNERVHRLPIGLTQHSQGLT